MNPTQTYFLNRKRLTLATLVMAQILSGCGQLATPTATSGTFTSIYTSTLSKTTCVSCHEPGGSGYANGVTLDFSTQALAYQTLTSATVSNPSEKTNCSGVKIVYPSNASKSYLAAVLFSDYNANNFAGVSGCQPYTVHLQNLSLSADEKTSILNWINNGALNN